MRSANHAMSSTTIPARRPRRLGLGPLAVLALALTTGAAPVLAQKAGTAADAEARMKYLVNSMAAGEVHIARYYFRRGAYVAAVNRAQIAIRQYPNAPAIEEALYIVMKSYEQLGLDDLRADAERVMKANFPRSALLTQGLGQAGAPSERRWWQVWR